MRFYTRKTIKHPFLCFILCENMGFWPIRARAASYLYFNTEWSWCKFPIYNEAILRCLSRFIKEELYTCCTLMPKVSLKRLKLFRELNLILSKSTTKELLFPTASLIFRAVMLFYEVIWEITKDKLLIQNAVDMKLWIYFMYVVAKYHILRTVA